MSSEPDDRELEEFLAGRDPIGAAYREASREESAPAELNAAILLAAREAARTPLRRRPRWLQPLALAATLALSLGVLLNLWRDPETRRQTVPEQGAAAVANQVEELRAPVQDEAAAPAETADAKPESMKKQASEFARRQSRNNTAPEHSSAAAQAKSAELQAAPAPPMPPARAMTEPAAAAGAAASGSEAEMRSKALPEEARQRRESESMSDTVRSSSFSTDEADASAQILSPDDWIKRILEMLERGDEKSARRELETFRKAHPDFALPDVLRKFADADETKKE